MSNTSSPRVLVTGGAGFIGSHTVDRLVERGCKVLVVDDLSTGNRENLARYEDDDRVNLVVADVAEDLEGVIHSFGPIHRIVHLAAQVSVNRSMSEPMEDLRVNCGGTIQVLELARATGVKGVVFASSAAVYGDVAEFPVHEDLRKVPISPYGINKLSSELYLDYYAQVHGVPTTALRFFNVYGPRQDPSSSYSGVISIFADRAAAGETITIFGDGEQTRDFVFVGDVSRAVADACLSDRSGFTVANLGTGQETSINDLAKMVVDLSKSSSPIEHADARAGDIVRSVAAIERARNELDFEPTVTIRDGLAETLESLRK
jgi:UDP-glucose 4-epimerase